MAPQPPLTEEKAFASRAMPELRPAESRSVLPVTPAPTNPVPSALEPVIAQLEAALAGSPAEETRLRWSETVVATASTQRRGEPVPVVARSWLSVAVREGRRQGSFETLGCDRDRAAGILRQALATARAAEPSSEPLEARFAALTASPEALCDPALLALDRDAARALLEGTVERGELARLVWGLTSHAEVATGSAPRQVRSSAAFLTVRSGRFPQSGSASSYATTLEGLGLTAVVERARQRAAPAEELAEPEAGRPLPEGPIVLSAEAAASLRIFTDRPALGAEREPVPDLLQAAEGGLWVGSLERFSPELPGSSRFRVLTREARRIEHGRLGAFLGELRWEDDLERLAASVLATGTEQATLPADAELTQAVTAAEVVLGPGGAWTRLGPNEPG